MSYYGNASGKPGSDFTVERKFDTSPLPANMRAARSQFLENAIGVLNDAIGAVKVSSPDKDSSQNARHRYERNYQRMRQAARQVVLAGGGDVTVPAYEPPPTRSEQFTKLTAADFPVDVLGQYRETGGRGKSATGVQPNFADPASDQHQSWLNMQGAAPIDTTGMSPDDANKARRKRAGAV